MASLPLATPTDLSAWLGEPIEVADARAGAVLAAVSARVRSFTGRWMDDDEDVPDDVKGVVCQVAARLWKNPASLESITADDTTPRWGASGTRGLHLTDDEKETLSAYIESGTRNIGSVGLSAGGPDGHRETLFVPTGPPPSGDPFPWYSERELWP